MIIHTDAEDTRPLLGIRTTSEDTFMIAHENTNCDNGCLDMYLLLKKLVLWLHGHGCMHHMLF